MYNYLAQQFTKHIAARRNKISPIYMKVELAGRQTRLSGGLFKAGNPDFFEQVQVLGVEGTPTRDTEQIKAGLIYTNVSEFHIPYDELSKLGYADGAAPQPGTMLYVSPDLVYRITNVKRSDSELTCVVRAERTENRFPDLTSAWNFEQDSVGDDPTDWYVDEPSDDAVKVVAGKYAQITNESGDPQMSICTIDNLAGPPKKVEFKSKWSGCSVGLLGHDYGGDANRYGDSSSYAFDFTIEKDGTGLHYKSGSYFDAILDEDEWYSFSIVVDRFVDDQITLTITKDSDSSQQSFTFNPFPSWANPITFFGFCGSGVGGVRQVDDVEVSCVA